MRFLFLFLISATVAADAPKLTVRGEIVDSYCYTVPSIRGAAHRACAIKCMKNGVPPVFVDSTTRRIYVLQASSDAAALPPALIDMAGKEIVIEGDVIAKGGVTFLTVRAFRAAP